MGIARLRAPSVRKRARARHATGCSAMASAYYELGMQNAERSVRRCSSALLLLLFAFCTSATAPGRRFLPALPGYEFAFPRDHGSHDEYRTEWWYYTGHLRTDDGQRYGFELTFFRVGVVPPGEAATTRWDLRNLSLAHFAITDIDANDFRYYEKLNRSSPFTAGAAAGTLDVFNEGWRATTLRDGSWRIVAYGRQGRDRSRHDARAKPPAIHGENGVSVKAEGAATRRTTTR